MEAARYILGAATYRFSRLALPYIAAATSMRYVYMDDWNIVGGRILFNLSDRTMM